MIDTKTDAAYQLGAWMGRKQAFASLAGRCSAADAECLRQIRHGKHYRALKLNWEQFCKQEVGVSYITVDKIIRRLEEFGPAYFILTQATGITENEYRRISSAVHEKNLLCAGEEIAITAENAPRLAAAVEALKQQARPALLASGSAKTVPKDFARTIDKVERTLAAVVAEIERLHNLPLDRQQRERLQRIVLTQLNRLASFPFVKLRRVS